MEEKMRELLGNYPLEVKHLYRGRGAWLCETDHGLKRIRPYYGSPKRLQCEVKVKEDLRERGCKYIDQLVSNNEGDYLVTDQDEEKYVVTDWYNGRECSTRDRQEIIRAVVYLAGVHRCMRGMSIIDTDMPENRSQNVLQEMYRRIKEFKTIRNYAAGKKQKNDFDRKFMEVYSEFNEDGLRALNILKDMDYLYLYEKAYKTYCVCHGDYNQHNVLVLGEEMALVNFDRMHVELQIYDLYMFMRKILEKNRWNMGLGIAMLDAYHRILPMDYRHARCLYSMFLFPEKFWKIVNRYHNSRKSWLSSQNMAKLDKVINEQEARKEFLQMLNRFCEKIE